MDTYGHGIQLEVQRPKSPRPKSQVGKKGTRGYEMYSKVPCRRPVSPAFPRILVHLSTQFRVVPRKYLHTSRFAGRARSISKVQGPRSQAKSIVGGPIGETHWIATTT